MRARGRGQKTYRGRDKTGMPNWQRSAGNKDELTKMFLAGEVNIRHLINTRLFPASELRALAREKRLLPKSNQ